MVACTSRRRTALRSTRCGNESRTGTGTTCSIVLATQLLLATLIQAADRVANTTGVYASFVKTWQPNATRRIRLKPLRPTVPPASSALGVYGVLRTSRDLAGAGRTVGPVVPRPAVQREAIPGLLPLAGTPGPGVGAAPGAPGQDRADPGSTTCAPTGAAGGGVRRHCARSWTWPMPGTCCSATTTRVCCSASVSRMRFVGRRP